MATSLFYAQWVSRAKHWVRVCLNSPHSNWTSLCLAFPKIRGGWHRPGGTINVRTGTQTVHYWEKNKSDILLVIRYYFYLNLDPGFRKLGPQLCVKAMMVNCTTHCSEQWQSKVWLLPGCVLRWWCYIHVGGKRFPVSAAHTHILLQGRCMPPPTGSLHSIKWKHTNT